ncbi:hypothetical protein BD770DRAFT_423547 [Pilaira anomala]|nr:hypothetical protein BD770DRAFT_423547 [Pilaira anomala]
MSQKGTYTTASTEWGNGSRSDSLYVPCLGIQNSLPPILIEFTPVDGKPWMQRILCCDFWAKSCYLVTKSSLLSNEEVDNGNISSLQALSMFLIEQSPTPCHGHSRPEHSTVRKLYRLAMQR